MRSQAVVPRAFRIATAIFLLGLAGLDQTRYAFVVHHDDLPSLQKAALLNPFDSSLETRLAKKQADVGNPDAATSAYQLAIATNLSDSAPRIAFLKYLTAHQRFAEADTVATQALEKWPNDANLLVNQGILASYFGRSAQAIASWEKAIAVDPAQTYAHLYLAGQLDSEQKFEAAIPHYTIFLEAAAKNGGRPDPNVVLPVLMRLADCNLRANHPEQALKLYELGRNIASQSHQPRIESVASLNQAMLESKSGRVGNALSLYQSALKLDRSANDPAAEGADWQAYGVFLDEQGYSKKLAYAAFVRAEALLRDANLTVSTTPRLHGELEIALGKDAAAIRKDPAPLLEQALQVVSKK
jgi:tetratricopeptide (TPR) repeat protein